MSGVIRLNKIQEGPESPGLRDDPFYHMGKRFFLAALPDLEASISRIIKRNGFHAFMLTRTVTRLKVFLWGF